jgi:tRNA modification GTPase
VEPRRAVYGRVTTGDDGIALPFPEGASYTGEESAELSVHGSPAAVRGLVEACLAAGARAAGPGEFTLRAFMSGRIDLTQAEGVRDLVAAQTDAQLRRAVLLRDGAARERLGPVREALLGVTAAIEASTDFGEEVGEPDRYALAERIEGAVAVIDAALDGARASRLVRQGLRVVIAGRPNAGKSSLLNALAQADRAIVTDLPGTTRDTVEEEVEIDGVPVRLIDTAGLRTATDEAERLGVERSLSAIASADGVLALVDGSSGTGEDAPNEIADSGRPWFLVATKADLPGFRAAKGAVAVSSVTGEGLSSVVGRIKSWIGETHDAWVNERHTPLLVRSREAALDAADTLRSGVPTDLAAVALHQSVRLLGEVTGETTPPDVIERIFSDFCIGK